MGRLDASLITRLSIKGIQAPNQLGTLRGEDFSDKGPNF